MGQRDDLCQKAAVVKRARRDFRESPAQGPGRILGRRGGLEDALLRTEQPLGEQFGDKKYLFDLFPYGPAKQAARYAGMPKPTGCV